MPYKFALRLNRNTRITALCVYLHNTPFKKRFGLQTKWDVVNFFYNTLLGQLVGLWLHRAHIRPTHSYDS